MCEIAYCCCSLVRSYFLRASSDLCPVLCCISLSGTSPVYNAVAPVTRSKWFVLRSCPPAPSNIAATIPFNLCFPTGQKAHTCLNQVYTSIHKITRVYTSIHKFTHVYTSIHMYAQVYTSIHKYTRVYTCLNK